MRLDWRVKVGRYSGKHLPSADKGPSNMAQKAEYQYDSEGLMSAIRSGAAALTIVVVATR